MATEQYQIGYQDGYLDGLNTVHPSQAPETWTDDGGWEFPIVQPSQAGLSDEEIIELKRGVIPLAYPAENDDLIKFARGITAAINAKKLK